MSDKWLSGLKKIYLPLILAGLILVITLGPTPPPAMGRTSAPQTRQAPQTAVFGPRDDCNNSPFCKTGFMDWRGSYDPQNTRGVVSRDGYLCVATNFGGYNGVRNPSYTWSIQKKTGQQQFRTVLTSGEYSANGNIDRKCHRDHVFVGSIYRVRFTGVFNVLNPRPYWHGTFTIRGWHCEAGVITATSNPRCPTNRG